MDNKELGRLVLKQVTEYPETFDMLHFGCDTACKTTACLAGHAMLLSGYTLVGSLFYRPDGTRVQREDDEAGKLLGMPRSAYYVFYYPYNTGAVEHFRRMVEGGE